jgi:hypothetical protein
MIVVVLNDGETYTTIEGVRVLRVPETVEDADLDQWVKDAYLNAEDVNVVEDNGVTMIIHRVG